MRKLKVGDSKTKNTKAITKEEEMKRLVDHSYVLNNQIKKIKIELEASKVKLKNHAKENGLKSIDGYNSVCVFSSEKKANPGTIHEFLKICQLPVAHSLFSSGCSLAGDVKILDRSCCRASA